MPASTSDAPGGAQVKEDKHAQRKVLGVFVLAMINVAAVLSLRNFPTMAEYGWELVFWVLIGLITFLLPVALVGAELASAYPKSSGVFDWVKEGLGDRAGFVGIWSEWVSCLVWFPTVLSFLSATLAYTITPSLANDKVYLFSTMLGIFWIVTLVNFMGDRWSGAISTLGTILGSIIPGVLIIGLGVYWLFSDQPNQIHFQGVGSLIPSDVSFDTLALVAGVTLLFAGMEMAGYHALETKNPQRDFPRAMFISAVIIFIVTALGSLAIAFVVPQEKISLLAGIMQTFELIFDSIGAKWLVRPMALLVFIGGIALLSTWIIGPAKGLHGPTREGLLPPMWAKENKRGVPVGVVILQGILGTVVCGAFLVIPGVSGAYWILTALTAQIVAIMYLLIFISAIRIRYTQPDLHRPYKIPGGKVGMWIVSGVGALAMAFTLIIGFFPPTQIEGIPRGIYPVIMGVGIAVLICPVFIFMKLSKPKWADAADKMVRTQHAKSPSS
jgi:glutamate:GABA antiporter